MIEVREIESKNLVTRTKIPAGDYVINPYIGRPHKCVYCYADFMARLSGHAGGTWGEFLDVKIGAKKINATRLKDKRVVISSATDPYNSFEEKYRLTRGVLEQFTESEVYLDVLTKSDLILRDIDLFTRIPRIRVGFSLNTLDDNFRALMEPFASSVDARLDALAKLHAANIQTFVFLSPLFPGISDFKSILIKCRTHADEFWFENLNLRPTFSAAVLQRVKEYDPKLIMLYHTIYRRKNPSYWEALEAEITAYCQENAIPFTSYFYHEKIRK